MAIMAIDKSIRPIRHALAGVSAAIMLIMIKVVQSRVLMALLAVMAVYGVTRGA